MIQHGEDLMYFCLKKMTIRSIYMLFTLYYAQSEKKEVVALLKSFGAVTVTL